MLIKTTNKTVHDRWNLNAASLAEIYLLINTTDYGKRKRNNDFNLVCQHQMQNNILDSCIYLSESNFKLDLD